MTYDLHIGVRNPQGAIDVLSVYKNIHAMFSDGDSWHNWGDDRDNLDKHVVIRVDRLGTAIDVALELAQPDGPLVLLPMEGIEGHYEPGTLVIVSDTDDWAEQYLDVRQGTAKLLAREVTV